MTSLFTDYFVPGLLNRKILFIEVTFVTLQCHHKDGRNYACVIHVPERARPCRAKIILRNYKLRSNPLHSHSVDDRVKKMKLLILCLLACVALVTAQIPQRCGKWRGLHVSAKAISINYTCMSLSHHFFTFI